MNNTEDLVIEMYCYLVKNGDKILIARQVYNTSDNLAYSDRVFTEEFEISNLKDWPHINKYKEGTRVEGVLLKQEKKYFIKSIHTDKKNYKV